MAFASSAMAAVNFGGSFEAVVENDSFTKANIELKNDFKLTVKAHLQRLIGLSMLKLVVSKYA